MPAIETVALSSLQDLIASPFDEIIDVRAPSEFSEDHVPGAVNLPVLTDAERAEVGKIYVQESRFRARKIGAAYVARNAALHLQAALADRGGAWRPLVYCWRGGQRSGSFATILAQVGWRVGVIEGGYRSYRRLVAEATRDAELPHRLILLDGNTGTAKTELLARLQARGHQVVDLEGLAAHRGSVFGGQSQGQPSQKAFESALAMAFARLDPKRPVIAEAESNKIGDLLIPPSIWAAMREAPRIEVSAPRSERARYLVRTYADLVTDPPRLEATLDQLVRLQGRAQVADWQALVQAGAFEQLAEALMAVHYDPRYARARAKWDARVQSKVAVPSLAPEALDGVAAEIETALLSVALAEA